MNLEPITVDFLKNGNLKADDKVVSKITFNYSSTGENVVKEGDTYSVVEVFPGGYVLDTNVGRWTFTFLKRNGGAEYFDKIVNVTEEDALGDFGTLPLDILNLINGKSGIRRSAILEYLAYKASADSPKVRSNVKNQILQALRFLEVHGYVELVENTLNKYSITSKGLALLGLDTPKYDMNRYNRGDAI